MNLKTDGIVLSVNKFKDNASIVDLYTHEVGRAAFLLYGTKSKKHKGSACLHPLSMVNIDVNIRNNRELNIINEIKQLDPNPELIFNPIKSALSFFVSEVLLHVLKTNEKDDNLFNFVRNSVATLSQSKKGLGNFHILFLIRLSRFLGFQPQREETTHYRYFDLLQAEYTNTLPPHTHFLQRRETGQMQKLLRMTPLNYAYFRFTKAEREQVINYLLEYYKLHTDSFGEIHSLEVLKEVFA